MTDFRVEWRADTVQDSAFLRRLHDLNRPEFQALPGAVRGQLLDLQYRAREAEYAARYPSARRRILLVRGEAVGVMHLDVREAVTVLVDFAVLPEWQGRGVGGAALRALQAECSRGRVCLQVRRDSAARRLYGRLGFRVVGQTDTDLAMCWDAPLPGRA